MLCISQVLSHCSEVRGCSRLFKTMISPDSVYRASLWCHPRHIDFPSASVTTSVSLSHAHGLQSCAQALACTLAQNRMSPSCPPPSWGCLSSSCSGCLRLLSWFLKPEFYSFRVPNASTEASLIVKTDK